MFPAFPTLKRLLLTQLLLVFWGALSLTIISDYVHGEFATVAYALLLLISARLLSDIKANRPITTADPVLRPLRRASLLLALTIAQILINTIALLFLWVWVGLTVSEIVAWLWIFLICDTMYALIAYGILKREEEEHVVTAT